MSYFEKVRYLPMATLEQQVRFREAAIDAAKSADVDITSFRKQLAETRSLLSEARTALALLHAANLNNHPNPEDYKETRQGVAAAKSLSRIAEYECALTSGSPRNDASAIS